VAPQAGTIERPAERLAIFARSGEYWTLGYSASPFSLKDIKGLSYIQRLLQHPEEELPALYLLSEGAAPGEGTDPERVASLLGDDALSVGGPGDAGEMLDPQAKREYRRRLAELEEELEELKRHGDHQRGVKVEDEIAFLKREMVRAVTRRGHDRRAGSASERARLNVTRAIKAALQKISEYDAPFGELLDSSIRTGLFCSYVPDPRITITWQFSVEGSGAPAPARLPPPLSSRPEAGFPRALSHRTAFVGREAERASLHGVLELVQRGEGRVVMISGPPGVGKTRLADEVGAEAVQKGFLALAGNCYDREDSAPFTPFVEMLEAALARAPSPQAFREALGADAPEIARLLPQLRRLFPDLPRALEISPEQSRRLLFNAVAEVLSRTARVRPVLLLLEDLHWADEGSLSLLNHVARLTTGAPVLIVGTYRDYELDAAGPLAQSFDELTRLHVLRRINLAGLSQPAVAEMIAGLSHRDPPKTLVDFIYSGTEGNPFFVEELFAHLVERGKLFDAKGEFRAGLDLNDVDVPQSLRVAIGRRLSRLDEDTRKVLATAALLGRSFPFELLGNLAGIDTDPLLDCIEEAEKAGLLSSTLQGREVRFQFSHELIRQAALTEISAARRQRLHLRVADAIERIYANILEDWIPELASHLWQAGPAADAARAIRYQVQASGRSASQGAHEATLSYLQNALELTRRLAPNGERDAQELGLYMQYLTVVGMTNRWTTSAAGSLYNRARDLCERLGQTAQMFYLLQGSGAFHLGRGEYRLLQECARRIDELAGSCSKPDWAVSSNYFMGHALSCLGDQVAAHRHLAEAVRLKDSMPQAVEPGINMKVSSLAIDGMALWISGHLTQSKQAVARSIAEAEALKDPYTLAFALAFAHIVMLFRREYSQALEIAERGLRIAAEKKLEWIQTSLVWSRDACRILAGLDTTIDRVRSAFEAYFASEAKLYLAANCTVLAECCAQVGQTELGLSMIERAFSAIEETGERMSEPETWRVKGLLLLARAAAERVSGGQARPSEKEAESCLRKAIEIAPDAQCLSWKLRAALSLSRWLMSSNRRAEARTILADIYARFTEDFDAPDLRDAATLLSELST